MRNFKAELQDGGMKFTCTNQAGASVNSSCGFVLACGSQPGKRGDIGYTSEKVIGPGEEVFTYTSAQLYNKFASYLKDYPYLTIAPSYGVEGNSGTTVGIGADINYVIEEGKIIILGFSRW